MGFVLAAAMLLLVFQPYCSVDWWPRLMSRSGTGSVSSLRPCLATLGLCQALLLLDLTLTYGLVSQLNLGSALFLWMCLVIWPLA